MAHVIGLVAFISSFWHMARADLWFMLSYSVGPFDGLVPPGT